MTNPLEKIREFISECRKSYPEGTHGSRYADGYNDASNDIADQLFAILTASQGYVCVPVEPTRAMLEHARTALVAANFLVQGEQPRTPEVQERILISAAYKAMLAISKETNRD